MRKHIEENKILSAIIVLVVACGLSFWGGYSYGQRANIRTAGAFGPGGDMAGRMGTVRGGRVGGSANGGFVAGTVTSKDATSITVRLNNMMQGANGTNSGSRIILFDATTQIAKSAVGSADDVTVGQEVTVSGTPNSDGSITAKSIQLRPAGSAPVGGPRGGTRAVPTPGQE